MCAVWYSITTVFSPCNHEHALLDGDAARFEREDRERIEAELSEVSVTLRMHGSGIQIRRQLEARSVDDQRLLHLREQKMADAQCGRLRGSDEESVIAPRIRARNGGRRETAQPVGLKPFVFEGLGQISAERRGRIECDGMNQASPCHVFQRRFMRRMNSRGFSS